MGADDIRSRFASLTKLVPSEVVTRSELKDIELPGRDSAPLGIFALITLDNGLGRERPTTLGPRALVELGALLEKQRQRAALGEIVGVGITGQPSVLAAGADLSAVGSLRQREHCRHMAQLGHCVYRLLSDLGVPSFVFVNGLALGGGLEIALNADYRTVSAAVGALALPEAFLGLIPGWGGTYLLPRLIGPDAAVTVMLENALDNNRVLCADEAFQLGIVDAIVEPAAFLEHSMLWASRIITGEEQVTRVNAITGPLSAEQSTAWDTAVARAESIVLARTSGAAPAPLRLVELLRKGKNWSRDEAFAAEDEALADLMQTEEFHATIYAFLDLVQKRARCPVGAPDVKLAQPVRKVGIVGAGLMASQLALIFARQLTVPVVMTDINQERVGEGVGYVHAEVGKLLAKKRISADAANHVKALVTGSVSKEVLADADLVIEAVFEELHVKKDVFAELERIVSPQCILATNTSSLSVTAMAEGLEHPERLVGFHFFNPVAVMPLVEIVQAPKTSDEVLATVFVTAKALQKNAVLVKDSAGFVVNRILLRLMSEVVRAFDAGTDAKTADSTLKSLGLPMSPFTLLDGRHPRGAARLRIPPRRFRGPILGLTESATAH